MDGICAAVANRRRIQARLANGQAVRIRFPQKTGERRFATPLVESIL